MGGLTLGGALVIAGIVIAIVWSVWIGVIVALVGLVAFGGFARGRWYCPGLPPKGYARSESALAESDLARS